MHRVETLICSCSVGAPDYKDPMAFLELLGRKNEHNYGRYDGKEFNDIIDAASTAEMLKKSAGKMGQPGRGRKDSAG